MNGIELIHKMLIPIRLKIPFIFEILFGEVLKIEKLHRGHRGNTEFREAQTTLNVHVISRTEPPKTLCSLGALCVIFRSPL
jgi:hypothetical protein